MVRSKIWNYFSKRENSKFVRCNICLSEYKSSGNTTNLFDHRKHLHAYLLVKDATDTDKSDSEMDEASTSTSSVGTEAPKKIQKRSSIKSYFNRDQKYSDTDKRKKDIDSAIVNMVTCDYEPFTIVENEGFKHLLNVLGSRYEIPSRGTLKDKMVPDAYNALREKLISVLSEVEYVSITTDIWSSPSSEGILTVTCHFITNKTLRSAVLKTVQLMGSHTGIRISEAIDNILVEWNIRNKVIAMLSYNGSNVVLAASLLKIRHIPCFAHVLNLLVQDVLKTENLSIILKRCKEIVTHFRQSTLSADKLRQKQEEAKLKPLKLIQETPTRWNSTLFMIRRILEIRQPLTLAISECEKSPNPINAVEINILEDLCSILKPFEEATNEISGEKYVTISMIIPVIRGITIKFQEMKDDIKSSLGKEVLDDCFSRIQARLYPYESRTPVLLGTILDPRCKKIAFRHHDHASNAQQLLTNEVTSEVQKRRKKDTNAEQSNSRIEPQQNEKSSKHLLIFLNDLVTEQAAVGTPTSDAIISVRQYLEKPPIPLTENPVAYWGEYNQCDSLKGVALKYLAIPATSVPSERVFSKAGLIMSDRRNRIKTKNLDIVIFIKSNKWLYE